MSIRALALAVAIAGVVAAPAAWAGGSGATYAYVTQAEPDWESPVDGHDYCDLTLQVPTVGLDTAPAKASDALLAGATLATAHVDDPDRTCFDLLHTWQPVHFNAADPAHVDVTLSRRLRFVLEQVLEVVGGITFLVGVLLMIAERMVRKRNAAARRHRARRGDK